MLNSVRRVGVVEVKAPNTPKKSSTISRLFTDGEIAFLAVLVILIASQFINMAGSGRVLKALPYLELTAGAIYTAHSVRNVIGRSKVLGLAIKAKQKKEMLFWSFMVLAAVGTALGFITKIAHGSLTIAKTRAVEHILFTRVLPIIFASFGGLGFLLSTVLIHDHEKIAKQWKQKKRAIFREIEDTSVSEEKARLREQTLKGSFFFSEGHKKAYLDWNRDYNITLYGEVYQFGLNRGHSVFFDRGDHADWVKVAKAERFTQEEIGLIRERANALEERVVQQISEDVKKIGKLHVAGLLLSACFFTAGLIHLVAPHTIQYSTALISLGAVIGIGRFTYTRIQSRRREKGLEKLKEEMQEERNKESLHSYRVVG
jgi:hypothetical protein